MMILLPLFGVLAEFLPYSLSVESKLYTDPLQLDKTEYDFVIIGAGTAGNVLANRLTEDNSFTILVVEAGVSNTGLITDEIPFLARSLFPNTSITWNYTTSPQPGLNGRAIPYPRGRVLGGSSTINLEIWTRASKDDWNRFANFTDDIGWSWEAMLPYMKKASRSEHLVPSPDRHNTSGEVIPALHGNKGPVQTSLGGFPSEVDQRLFNTTQEFPQEFPFNEDMNSGIPLGIGWVPYSVSTEGRRSSSATAYLEPVLNRSNLDVLIMTQVTKLIPSNTIDGVVHFDAIEMAQSPTSAPFTVSAKKEIIICAGAVNTPHLLQLSGIGDGTILSAVGIEPIVELEDVGQHLMDHPALANSWFANSTHTSDNISRNATLAAEILQQWEMTGTGRYCDPGTNIIGWLRLPQDGSAEDASAGPTAAQIELIFSNGFMSFVEAAPATGHYFSISTIISSPFSRGNITLASNDPFDSPLINPGLLSDPRDVSMMLQALKTAVRMLQAPTWSGYILEPVSSLAAAMTDEALEEYARNFTYTEFHPIGSARMAPASSKEGVLTPSLKVKGTSGLRVVDASVFPFIPASHPQACIYAVAERAVDLIKSDWL
ncbi:aryl-alcohol oxidase-like protein [Obba rivulosa]|uniref:Aryl-alcohol oxidase-like protein n=1 Tax=Obba rivulosa TaxID=1052685 RepID=A0A8E2DP12_9APHY|nr:aryl-alcohol oxidase-like protein [Obba rivulosa]